MDPFIISYYYYYYYYYYYFLNVLEGKADRGGGAAGYDTRQK